LVVASRKKAQMNLTKRDHFVGGQEITPFVVGAVQPERVELADDVAAVPQTLRRAPTRVEARGDDIANSPRPLALNTQKSWPKVQHQVIALIVERAQDAEAELNRASSDLRLRESSLLIRRQHGQHYTRSVGRIVVRSGDGTV
jgi:hypothetical protein